MSIFLYLHLIAAKRGDGLRAELIYALKHEHFLDGAAVLTTRDATVCPQALDAPDVTHSDVRKSDTPAK